MRFTDDSSGEEPIALGLPASRLALAAAGAAGSWSLGQAAGPVAVRLLLAASVGLLTSGLCWLRLEQRPLFDWAVFLLRFILRRLGAAHERSGRWLWPPGEEPADPP